MIRNVRNPDAYLCKAVCNFRDDCTAGFSDVFAGKRVLFQVAINIYEIAEDPDPWIGELIDIALGHMKQRHVESAINGAARKVGRRGLLRCV
jgi:hypothetical protein